MSFRRNKKDNKLNGKDQQSNILDSFKDINNEVHEEALKKSGVKTIRFDPTPITAETEVEVQPGVKQKLSMGKLVAFLALDIFTIFVAAAVTITALFFVVSMGVGIADTAIAAINPQSAAIRLSMVASVTGGMCGAVLIYAPKAFIFVRNKIVRDKFIKNSAR